MDIAGERAIDVLFDLYDLVIPAMFAIGLDSDFYHDEIIVYYSIYIIWL